MMTFDETFRTMKKYFSKKNFRKFGDGVFSYEFDVTGDGAGRFYVEVRDGVLAIQPFDYRNSLCVFTISSDSLKRILSRSLSPVEAYATGRLAVRGDLSAAFRLADALGLDC